jgi:hypothetical protein
MAKRGRPRKDVKRYIMRQTMHLGYIRETVGAGMVIEHDEHNNKLIIDGRSFDSVKDLDILKKHGWVVEYSSDNKKEVEKEIKAKEEQKAPEPDNSTKNIDRQEMKVIKSDQDVIEVIDISHTKPQKPVKEEKKEMEVIKGDESPQERLDRLQTTIPEMEIIGGDDTLGVEASNAPSLNEGQKLPSSDEGQEVASSEEGQDAPQVNEGQNPPKKAVVLNRD